MVLTIQHTTTPICDAYLQYNLITLYENDNNVWSPWKQKLGILHKCWPSAVLKNKLIKCRWARNMGLEIVSQHTTCHTAHILIENNNFLAKSIYALCSMAFGHSLHTSNIQELFCSHLLSLLLLSLGFPEMKLLHRFLHACLNTYAHRHLMPLLKVMLTLG